MIRKFAIVISMALVFTIPWETAITFSSLGTLTRLIGFSAAGVWFLSVLVTGKVRKLKTFHFLVLLFILFNLSSIFWTIDQDITTIRIKTYIQLAILVLILWDLINTPESLYAVMQVFILGAYPTIAGQIYNYVNNQYISIYDQGRFSSMGQNAVELAVILCLSIPIAWHLATTYRKYIGSNILKLINFAYIPLALFSVTLTASRTALLAFLPALLYILATMRRIKVLYRVLIYLFFAGAFLVAQFYVPQTTLARLATVGDSISSGDFGGRGRLWVESLLVFIDHPVLGIGTGALDAPDHLGTFSHNTFISLLAELGLVGFFLFLLVLLSVVVNAIRQPRPYAILWITVITIWLVGSFSLTWEFSKPTWFFMNLIILGSGIHNRKVPVSEVSNIPVSSYTFSPQSLKTGNKLSGSNAGR